MLSVAVEHLEGWRTQARRLLAANIAPPQVVWDAIEGGQAALFATPELPEVANAAHVKVAPRFFSLAEAVACNSAPERWQLLYTLLWRLTHGEPHLLRVDTDPIMHRLLSLEKDARRDAYKVKAFVRFRLIEEAEGEHYIAWHKTDHPVLRLIAGFFKERFSVMRWTIVTPYESMHWDGKALKFGPGLPSDNMPNNDAVEAIWKAYYRATFNPARIKIKAMLSQMPKRYWSTMPETAIIADMLREAPVRVQKMLQHQEGLATGAVDFLPPAHERTLVTLGAAVKTCQGCPLHCGTTQAVFGEGPTAAKLMLVGEQPGYEEDRAGRPFIGPAGKVLAQAMEEAGLARDTVYLTNAVKHFKHWKRKDKAFHRNPDVRDIAACKPWLQAEIDAVQPQFILALGASAGKSLLGPGFTLKARQSIEQRTGNGWVDLPLSTNGAKVRATYHPAAILRAPQEVARRDMFQALVTDLIFARRALASLTV